MTNREKYLKVAADLAAAEKQLEVLPGQIDWDSGTEKTLAEEVTRREVLGEPGGPKAKELQDVRARLRDNREARERLEHRIKVTGGMLDEIRGPARLEMSETALASFRKPLQEFAKALEAARSAEVALVKAREDLNRQFDEIGAPGAISQWPALVLQNLGRPEPNNAISNFLASMKSQGLL